MCTRSRQTLALRQPRNFYTVINMVILIMRSVGKILTQGWAINGERMENSDREADELLIAKPSAEAILDSEWIPRGGIRATS